MGSKEKRIAFLFPDVGNKPIGGYKIVLQYANMFIEYGYSVHIVYSSFFNLPLNRVHSFLRIIKHFIKYVRYKFFGGYSCRKWFPLNLDIKEHFVWSLYSSPLPQADYYVATAGVTANALKEIDLPDERKAYFIQDYEPWLIGEDSLIKTYCLPYKKIVVSQWLKRIVDQYSLSYYVPNGFNTEEFSLTNPILDRSPYVISILYHEMEKKGFKIGYEALCLVKEKFPQLKVLVFGVYERPSYMPEWFLYHKNPDQKLHKWINNEASIYLAPAISEGFGLTVGEAMLCGQAVVCTDNEGYREMAVSGKTALICPVGNPRALADAVIKLITDEELRVQIAEQGYESMREHTVENSFLSFKSVIELE